MPSDTLLSRVFTARKKLGRRLILQGMIAAVVVVATAPKASAADPVTWIWDADAGNAGLLDGSGSWSTGSTTATWWNGTSNVLWTDSTPANPIIAQFGSGGGATAKTVTVTGTVQVAGIIFGAVGTGSNGYTLSGGTIAIADNGSIVLGDGATTAQTFATINSALSGANITIQRNANSTASEQFLALAGNNTWTGKLTIAPAVKDQGSLFLRATAGALNSLTTIEVGAGNTLSLQGANAVFTSNFIVAGVGSGGSPQRGAMRFDNNMTLNGTITLADDAVFNFQSSTPTASDVIFNGGIGETGGSFDFIKTGLGTLTLRGASTFTGSTMLMATGSGVQPGTMVLDFANSTTTTDLLYNGVSKEVVFLTGNTLRNASQSNATLSMVGKDGTVNNQTVAGLAVSGPTTISVTSGVGGTANMNLGSIIRANTTGDALAGTTLSIIGPASGSVTTTTNNGTLLGMWATYTNASGVTTWAGSNGLGVIGAFTGETNYATGTDLSLFGGEAHITLTSGSTGAMNQSGTATIASVTMADTSNRVITVGSNRLNVDGIQLLNGAGNLTVGAVGDTGSISASGNESEMFLSNFSSASVLTINSAIAGGISLTLNGTGTTILAGASTYSGTTTVASGTLEVRSNTALGGTGRTYVGTGATLRLAGGLTMAEPLTLSGSGVSGNGVLVSSGAANSMSGAITLTGDPVRIVTDADNTLTLTGIVSNSANLVKAGSGTLVLSGANIFTGTTTVAEGVLRITSAAALGNTSASTTVSSGAALEISSASSLSVAAEPLSLNGSGIAGGGALRNVAGNNTYRGLITLQSATRINSDAGTLTLDVASGSAITSALTQTLTFGGAGNIVVADAIASTANTLSVTKDGTGTLTLSGANTYAGTTTILGGTLALGANDVFSNSAPLVVNGGTFSIGAFSDTLAGVTLQSGAITGTTGVLTATTYTVLSGSISANLAGTSASTTLTKSSSGTVTLSGTNTFTGATTINAGRLVLDYSSGATVMPAANALSIAGGTLEVRGGATSTPISLGAITMASATGMGGLVIGNNAAVTATGLTRQSGSALLIDLSAAGSSLSFTSAQTTSNGLLMGTGGTNAAIVMKDASGVYDFAAQGAGNTVVRLNAGTSLPASGGTATTNYVLNGSQTLTGSVSANTLRIDATNGGTLDLAGRTLTLNQFGLLVDGAGDYRITNSTGSGSLNGTSAVAVYVYQFGTGKLTLDVPISSLQAFFMGTGLVDWTASTGVANTNHLYGSTLRISGTALSMGSTGSGNTAVLNIANGGILELAYDGDGTAGSGDFTRSLGSGAGSVRFLGEGGFSAYGADRVVNLGGAASTITWGSTSNFLASGNKLILGSKYANAVVDFKNGLNLNGATQTIEVQSTNASGIGGKVSGNIIGSGNLTKTGQGILTLGGANTYTGATLVSEGTLAITGSILNSSSIGVSTGAELQLSGSGSVSAGSLAFDNASKLSLEVGTLTSSTISLTGTATLTGSIALAMTLVSDPTDGHLFTFIDSAMLAGYSTGARFLYNGIALNEGDLFTVSSGSFSQIFQISYHGGSDGGDVTVLAVPEPSTAFTLMASTGLLVGLNRFRRRR